MVHVDDVPFVLRGRAGRVDPGGFALMALGFWRPRRPKQLALPAGGVAPGVDRTERAAAGAMEQRQPPQEPLVLGDAVKMANRRTVAILTLSLPRNELVALVESVLVSTKREPYLPVFLTDAIDLAPFRERSLVMEYLSAEPPAGQSSAEYEVLVLSRLAIWRRKWCFSRLITAGPAARRRLDTWRTLPNVEPSLLELFTSA